MARTLTKKQASKRLSVTPEKHKTLDHISVDQGKTLIEVADEALDLGIQALQRRGVIHPAHVPSN